MFPLGKTGGLIEATYDQLHVPPTYLVDVCFRWVKPAASLKHDLGVRQEVRQLVGFRWVKPAASEATGSLALPSPMQGFPLGKTGGLIEAYVCPVSREPSFAPLRPFPLGKTGGLIEAAIGAIRRAFQAASRYVSAG